MMTERIDKKCVLSIIVIALAILLSALAVFAGGNADADETPVPAESGPYIYESDFSSGEDKIQGIPEYWSKGRSFFSGVNVYMQNNALYLDSKTASGIQAIYFNGMTGCDYVAEADLTMLDKTDNNRWMGMAYRVDKNGDYLEFFHIAANNNITLNGYYGTSAQTGTKGWNSYKQVSGATVKTEFPAIADKVSNGQPIHYKIVVAGDELIGYIDECEVIRDKIKRAHLLDGQLAFASSNTLVKIENLKITSLAELTQDDKNESIVSDIEFPRTQSASTYIEENNYTSQTTINFGESEQKAFVTVSEAGDAHIRAFVDKNGNVGIERMDGGTGTNLLVGTVAITDISAVNVKVTVACGYARLWIDDILVGTVYVGTARNIYGVTAADGVTYTSGTLRKTNRILERMDVRSDMPSVDYGTVSPDWSALRIDRVYSDGSVARIIIGDGMISGYDPYESGEQTITVTYEWEGETFMNDFTVTVEDNPEAAALRIGIMSDVHVGANASNETAIKNALRYYKERNIDLLVLAGDIGHNYYDNMIKFEDIFESVYSDPRTAPDKVYVMGNHDTYSIEERGFKRGTEAHNKEIERVFTGTYGVNVDYGMSGVNYYKIVNGYVFVGLYVQTPIKERAAMIAKAYELPEAEGKPVFIVQHEIPIGSVYIANGTDSGAPHDFEMNDVLENYPNAIMLAGHAHNPLADERAIWQDGYTVVTYGSLFGPIVERNMYEGGTENGSFQPDLWSAKSALYMEVSAGAANITRYDFTHNEKLGKNWVIPIGADGTVDRTPYNYESRKAAAVAPEFAAGAIATAEPISESTVTITFPKAVTTYPHNDDIIQSYIIRAYDKNTDELCGVKRVITQHYLGCDLDYDSYTLRFNGLSPDIDYRFEITAVESYQKEGTPLTVETSTREFAVGDRPAEFHTDFSFPWDKNAFYSYTHVSAAPVKIGSGAAISDARSSSKIIVRDIMFDEGIVETSIAMTSRGGLINGGLFLFAADAADEQDTITALNINLESAVNSRDLKVIIYRFNGKYDTSLANVILTDYFADGAEKSALALKVEVTQGLISVFVDGKLRLTCDAATQVKPGSVGLRAHYSELSFGHLKVYRSDGGYTAPDTAELETAIARAKELSGMYETGTASTVVCGESYVPQSALTSLDELTKAIDVDLVKAYERNAVNALALINKEIAAFEKSVAIGAKHVSDEWTVTKIATCTESGLRECTCTVCGKAATEIMEKIPHAYGETSTHDATCTEKGYTYRTCNVCGGEEKLGDIAAKGHTDCEWVLVVDDGADTGERRKYCAVCEELLETEPVYVITDTKTDIKEIEVERGMSGVTIALIVVSAVEGVIIILGIALMLNKKRAKKRS